MSRQICGRYRRNRQLQINYSCIGIKKSDGPAPVKVTYETDRTSPSIKKAKQSDPSHNLLEESHELNTPDKLVKGKLETPTKNKIKENPYTTTRRPYIHKLRRHSLNGVHYVNQGRNKARLKPGRNVYKKLKLRHRIGYNKYVKQSELSPEARKEKKPEELNDCRMSDATTGSDIQREYREMVSVKSASYQPPEVNAIGPTLQGNDKTTQHATTMQPTLIPVTIIPCNPNQTPTPLEMNPISLQNHTLQLQPTLTLQPIPSSCCPNSIQSNIKYQNPLKQQQQLIRTVINQPYLKTQPTNDIIPHPPMTMEHRNINRTLTMPISNLTANTQAVPSKSTYNTVTPNPFRCIEPAPKLLAIEHVDHAQPINPSMPRSHISASKHPAKNNNQSFKPMASITPMSPTVVGHSHAGPLKGQNSPQIVRNKPIVSLAATDASQIIYSPPIEYKNFPNVSNPISVPSINAVQFPQATSSAGPVQPLNMSNVVAVGSYQHTRPMISSKVHTRPQIATSTTNVTIQEQSAEAQSSNVSQVNMEDTSSVAKDKTESFNHILNIDDDQFDNHKKHVKEYKKLESLCLRLQELEEVKRKELNIVTQKKQSTIRELCDIQKSLHIVTFKDMPMEKERSVKTESLFTPYVNQSPLSEYELASNLAKQSEEDISDKISSKIASSTQQDIEKENEIKVKENAEILIIGNNVVSGIIEHVNETNITDEESNVIDSMIDHTEQSYKIKDNRYEKMIPQNVIEINENRDDIYTSHCAYNIVNQLLHPIVKTVSATSNDKQRINHDTINNIQDKTKVACTNTTHDPNQSSTKISDEGSSKEKLVQSTLSAAIGLPSGTSCRGRKRGRPRKHFYEQKYLKNYQKHEYKKTLQKTQMRDYMLPVVFTRKPNEIKQVEPARKLTAITPEKSVSESNHQVLLEYYSQDQHHPQGRNQGYSNSPIQYRPSNDPLVPQIPPLYNVHIQPTPNIPRVPPESHQNKGQSLTAQEEYWQNVGFQRGLNYQNPQQSLHRQQPPKLYPPPRFDYQSPRHQQVHTQCSPPGYSYPDQIDLRIPHERSGDNYQTSTRPYNQFLEEHSHQQPIAPRGPSSAHANHCVIHSNQPSPNYQIVKEAERYRIMNYQHPQQQIQPAPSQTVVIEPHNQATQERVLQNQDHVVPGTQPERSQDVLYRHRQFTEYRPQVTSQPIEDYIERHEYQMSNNQHRNSYAEAQPQIHKELLSPNDTAVNNHINNPGINYKIPESSNHVFARDIVSPNGQHIIQVSQNKPNEAVTYRSNLTGSIELNQQILPSGAIAAIIKTNGPADKERIMMQSNQIYHQNTNNPYSASNLNIGNNPTEGKSSTNKNPPPYQEVPNSSTTIINGPSIILSDDDDDEQEDVNKAAADTSNKAKIRFLRCSHCVKEATFVCSGCNKTTYCSNECQHDAWKSHLNDCAI